MPSSIKLTILGITEIETDYSKNLVWSLLAYFEVRQKRARIRLGSYSK